VWLPFVLALLWQALVQPRRLYLWIGAGLLAALIGLGGHGPIVLYAAYGILAWWVVAGWQAQKLWPVVGRKRQWSAAATGTVIFWACVLGMGVGPRMLGGDAMQLSEQAALAGELSGELAVRETWQLVLPGVFMPLSPLYVGALGLVLVSFAVSAASWGAPEIFLLPAARANLTSNTLSKPNPRDYFDSRWMAGFFAAVALLGLLAAYGTQARLMPLLYRFVPGWELARGHEQGAAYLVVLGLSALAGLSVVWIPRAGRTLRKRVALIGGGVLTVLVYSFGLLYQLLGNTEIGNFTYLWLAFYTLGFGLAGCLLLWLDGWSKLRNSLIVVLAATNLFIANMVY
jgi:hypothetical protein